MARTWDEIKRNICLLNELLAEVNMDLKQVVQHYRDSDFYLRVLELEGAWTEEDAQRLQEMARGTRHHRNHRDVRTYVADLLLGWVVQDVVTETHWPYDGKPAFALNLRLLNVQFVPFHEFPKDLLFAE